MHAIYFNFHDFSASTSLLSTAELGLYLKLLALYYEQEAPIQEAQCERIARAYAGGDLDSLSYILSQFFVRTDDGWRQPRADREIAALKEKSEKAKAAIAKRWSRGGTDTNVIRTYYGRTTDVIRDDIRNGYDHSTAPAGKSGSGISSSDGTQKGMGKPGENEVSGYGRNTDVIRTYNERKTDVIQDIRHKTEDIYKKRELEREVAPAPLSSHSPAHSHTTGSASKTHLLDFETLPETWRAYCQTQRPDLNPEKVFTDFRFYFLSGSGLGTRRSDKGWSQSWQNWVRREKEKARAASKPVAHTDINSTEFTADYYKQGL